MKRRVSTRASTSGTDPFGNDRSRPATSPRVLSRVTGLPVLALLLVAVGCGLAGCGLAGSGGREGDVPEGVSRGGAGGDPTPVLSGSWAGTMEAEAFGPGRVAFNLEQGGGGELSGTGSLAIGDSGGMMESVEGRVRTPDDVTLSYEVPEDEGSATWAFEGGMEDGSISEMSGEFEVSFEEDGGRRTETGTFELERYPDLSSDPRALAVAAVQAVYDRNFFFLAENAHPDYEEFLQEERYPTDFSSSTLAGAVENQFEDETGEDSYTDPPPAGVTVGFDEASVREEAQEGAEYYITFDHGLSGGEGSAMVALKTTGVDEATAWRVNGIGLEYGDNERLTLADTY